MEGGGIQRQLQSKSGRSVLGKYQQTVLGRHAGIVHLLYYELIQMAILPIPGWGGAWLRRLMLPPLFHSFGRHVDVDQDISFRRPSRISLGNHVRIRTGVAFEVKNSVGSIVIQDHVAIGERTVFSCLGGRLVVSEGCTIGKGCRLGSMQGLTLGGNCRVGDQVCIIGAGHSDVRLDVPIIQQPLTCRGESVIGSRVTIGDRATLLDGVTIGDQATIAADSLVTRDVPSGCRAAGVPARQLS